jgi:hypothetical protein
MACGAIASLVTVVACSSNPTTMTNPTSSPAAATGGAGAPAAAVTDVKSGITLTAPLPLTPTDGQQFKFSDQPLTLTLKNAATSGSTPLTYSFQVASDSSFGTIVFTKDGVAEGPNGQTAITISVLPGPQAKSYFWRARAQSGSLAGPFSRTLSFTVGPQVVLSTPTPQSPLPNQTVSGALVLTVAAVGRSGPAGPIIYTFDLSDSASFDRLLFSATVAEQPGSTSVPVDATLMAGTYFWRVQASDATNGISTPPSAVVAFTYQPFTLAQATIIDSPTDLANWAETAKITSVHFSPIAFEVDFDRRNGPDRWGDTPFGSGSLQYTLGMCLNIGGHWYCSGVVQFWFGRELTASTPPAYVGRNWFYDARWGPMNGYQPADGELVGLFVGAGNLRDKPNGDGSYFKERSNVAFVTWQNGGDTTYTFSKGKIIGPSRRRR